MESAFADGEMTPEHRAAFAEVGKNTREMMQAGMRANDGLKAAILSAQPPSPAPRPDADYGALRREWAEKAAEAVYSRPEVQKSIASVLDTQLLMNRKEIEQKEKLYDLVQPKKHVEMYDKHVQFQHEKKHGYAEGAAAAAGPVLAVLSALDAVAKTMDLSNHSQAVGRSREGFDEKIRSVQVLATRASNANLMADMTLRHVGQVMPGAAIRAKQAEAPPPAMQAAARSTAVGLANLETAATLQRIVKDIQLKAPPPPAATKEPEKDKAALAAWGQRAQATLGNAAEQARKKLRDVEIVWE